MVSSLNDLIPNLGNRVMKHGIVILIRKRPSDINLPAELEKLVRIFLAYIKSISYKPPIQTAINEHNQVGDQQITDTLTVVSDGADHYGRDTDARDIISKLVGDKKLPAQTGGQKSKIRKYKKTRSIKNA